MSREPSHAPIRRRFRLPSSLEQLAPLRAQLRSLLRTLGLPEATIHDVVLATHEAAVNGMVHGNGGDETRRVEVEVTAGSGQLVVQVSDEGNGFGWREWLRRGLEHPPPPDALSGRGIRVMASVMDEVTYNRPGSAVRLTKRLEG